MASQSEQELLEEILQKAPYLGVIDRELEGVENGIVGFEVRIYHGKVTDVTAKHVRRYNLKDKS